MNDDFCCFFLHEPNAVNQNGRSKDCRDDSRNLHFLGHVTCSKKCPSREAKAEKNGYRNEENMESLERHGGLMMKFGALHHVVSRISRDRVTLSGKDEEQHHSEENRGEYEKFVNDGLLILQVHEDQSNQTGFESSYHQTKRDVHGPIMEIDVVSGKNGEPCAEKQDQANFLVRLDVVFPVVIIMTMVMGSWGSGCGV